MSAIERDLVDLAHDFAEREVRPVARHHDETEEFPWDVVRKAAAIGLTCYDLPETLGGGGLESVLAQCLIAEELSWGDGPIANAITSNGFFAGPILRMGTEEQRERFLPGMRDASEVWCQSFSEPDAGSDLSSIRTRAVRDGDTFVVSGQKVWTSRANLSRWNALPIATVTPCVWIARGGCRP